MRVLIISGAGSVIGGRVAALALRRQGLPVAVYEAAEEAAPDAGRWLPPNAMQLFERLGLAEAIRAVGVELEHTAVQSPGGAELLGQDFFRAAEQYGAAPVALSRRALAALLAEHLPAYVLHRGKPWASFSEKGRQVTARFEDGTEVSGEVLLGADGAASGVRRQLFPGAALRSAGQVRFEGVWPHRPPPAYAREACEIWGREGRFGFMPAGREKVGWWAVQRADRAALAEAQAAFPRPAATLIGGTPRGQIARAEVRDLAPLAHWHRGRVALLGDAAHAATPDLGQGLAAAVEDAYVLAQALAAHGTPTAAFSKYEDVRMEKARRVGRRSRRLGQWAHARRAWARRLRDGALQLLPAAWPRRLFRPFYTLHY